MIKKYKFKRYFLVLVFLIGLFFIGPGLKVNAAEIKAEAYQETSNSWGYIEDTSIFDANFVRGDVNTWIRHKTWWFGTKHKTGVALQIKNKDTGKLIDKITMIHAEIKFAGIPTPVTIEKKWDGDNSGFMKWGTINSTDGSFTTFYGLDWKDKKKQKEFDKWRKEFADFSECNYRWDWNYNIEKFIALYVWYPNPKTGEIEAASFYENGEHPRFDANGELIGIFDADNNLCNDLTLNDIGIIENVVTGKEQITMEEQNRGVSYPSTEKDLFEDFWSGLFESSQNMNILEKIAKVFQLIILIVAIGFIFWLIFFIGKKIYKVVKS